MSSADGVHRSPLDKPLHLLNEDDIFQLTREDCRRYLKEKGMRRPSWNKSQAIQQVISLKALLEPGPDSDLPKKPRVEVEAVDVPSPGNEKIADMGDLISADVEELNVPVRKDYTNRHHDDRTVSGADLAAGSPRVSRETNLLVNQLTIFYSGKVNVYDDVSRVKARTLLQMAASPLSCLLDNPYDGTPVVQPHTSLQQHLTTKAVPSYLTANQPHSQIVKVLNNCQLQKEENSNNREEHQVEAATSRKACVQRYREKRKDSLPHFPSKCSPAVTIFGDLNLSANNADADEL